MQRINVTPTKTYATEANAVKAAESKFGRCTADLRYFIQRTDEGRFFPIFVGAIAVQMGVHFHFNVIG